MFPVLIVPSPNDQLKEYGGDPPEADPVKLTSCPTLGWPGLNEKLADNGGGVTVTVWDAVAFAPAESVTSNWTAKDPLVA